jgi:hypothetical protein
MTMVSITRLRLRSLLFLPHFVWLNERSVRQLTRSAGFRGGKLLWEAHLTFWTLSLWDSEGAMREFRDAGDHRHAMPKLARWCDEAAVARMMDATVLPAWPEAHYILVSSGRASRLRHPSPRNAALHFPPPRPFLPERVVKAVAAPA